MNSNTLYLNKGYFVQYKKNKLTDDYLIGKVIFCFIAGIRKRSLWNRLCSKIKGVRKSESH